MHASKQYKAYKSLAENSSSSMDHFYPKYMLLCNCIELSLKARLLSDKLYNPDELKNEFETTEWYKRYKSYNGKEVN